MRWMQEIRQFQPSTVSRRLSVVCGFYRTCVLDTLLPTSPAEHVRRPPLPTESPTLGLGHLQFEAILTAARQSANRYDFALVAMLGLLGLRIFEATSANISDLAEEHGHRVLRVHGKGDKVVLVPLPPAVGRALDRAIDGRRAGPILLNRRGARMDRHAATRRLRQLATTAGVRLPRMHPHMLPAHLRHYDARRRRRPPRRADRRPPCRPQNHHALRPSQTEPRPPPQLHPRRLNGLRHLTTMSMSGRMSDRLPVRIAHVSKRWDETWHRLREWTSGQGPAERLAVQILLAAGFDDVDPSHPLGGKDGGKDVACMRDGVRHIGGFYFPRGEQPFADIESKFTSDLKAARERNDAEAFVFVTNQELRLAERKTLKDAWPDRVSLYHLERVTSLLDQPALASIRAQFLNIDEEPSASGGDGGSGTIFGNRGTIIGGEGGRGGTGGSGGHGGSGTVFGDNGLIIGGDGGDAGGGDGRGGRGARGPTERYGSNTSMWGFGRGGRAGDAPEYIRRLGVLTQIRQEYLDKFPEDAPYILAGIDPVPIAWVNQRLDELDEGWHVVWGEEGYVLPPLPK